VLTRFLLAFAVLGWFKMPMMADQTPDPSRRRPTQSEVRRQRGFAALQHNPLSAHKYIGLPEEVHTTRPQRLVSCCLNNVGKVVRHVRAKRVRGKASKGSSDLLGAA
jgi:hypothetical protein